MNKNSKRILIGLGILIAIIAIIGYFFLKPAEIKVLVFSNTEGYRHESIESGIEVLQKMGAENEFTVKATEDPDFFKEDNLKDFMAVVFLNTTADVLDPVQQSEMARFIQAGGGFVGIHAATDTEYGWPYFIANNKAYHQRDFSSSTPGNAYDTLRPVNDSPNNTGIRELPPAQPAMIYYPYRNSEEFPAFGTGGRNAMAGPIFYSEDYEVSGHNWPKYFDGKILAYDWMRGWIFAVAMNEDGGFKKMTHIVPNMEFNNPIDIIFGADGALYVLEYGT